MTPGGLHPGPDGWMLAPEGAAVRPARRLAVIADVHLGYEWARAANGDCLPAHSLAETLAKLSSLLGRCPEVDRLVVAGDLVETPRPCPRTAGDVRRLRAWLAGRGVALVPLRGNHDPRRVPPLPSTCEVDGWTIGHGDRPMPGGRTIFGHHHPLLRAGPVAAPCFLVGPSTIALPAFSPNAAGLDILAAPGAIGGAGALGCVASSGGVLLDFGDVAALRVKLGAGHVPGAR